MTENKVFLIITLVDTKDEDGNVVPAGSVVNRIVWDGITPYDPGENLILVEE